MKSGVPWDSSRGAAIPETPITQPLIQHRSTMLCPWKLRKCRACFVNEFALQQKKTQGNIVFCHPALPQRHKFCTKGRRQQKGLQVKLQAKVFLRTHKDTSIEFKDCPISLQSGTRQVAQTSLVTHGSQKRKSYAGESTQRMWAFSHSWENWGVRLSW